MKAGEIVKTIMERKGIRPSDMAKRLQISQQALAGRFTQKNISMDKMNDMLRTMDYEIYIIPTDCKIPAQWKDRVYKVD